MLEEDENTEDYDLVISWYQVSHLEMTHTDLTWRNVSPCGPIALDCVHILTDVYLSATS